MWLDHTREWLWHLETGETGKVRIQGEAILRHCSLEAKQVETKMKVKLFSKSSSASGVGHDSRASFCCC